MSGVIYIHLRSRNPSANYYGYGETVDTILDMSNGQYLFSSGFSPVENASYAQLTSPNGFDSSGFTVNVKWLPNNDIVYTVYHTPLPRDINTRVELTRATFNLDDVLATVTAENDVPLVFNMVNSDPTIGLSYGFYDYSNTPSGNTVNSVTYPSDYNFTYRSEPNDGNIFNLAAGLGTVYSEAEPEAEPEAEAEPATDDVVLTSFPMGRPSFVINNNPPDYIDFVYTFTDIPISNFYPTNLSDTHSRYTLSTSLPFEPNGTNTFRVRATYTKDSGSTGGGIVGIIGQISSKVYHNDVPEGPLLFQGGGSLTTDLSLLTDSRSFTYSENPPSYYTGNGVPDDSNGNDNDYYLDLESMFLYQRSAGSWSFQYNTRRIITLTGLSTDLSSSIGFVGDYYFATDTNTLYGPKTTSGWSSSGTSVSGGFASGYGVPDDSLGLTGSWWLDMQTNTLYGPKTSDTSWAGASTMNLGQSSFLSGFGIPSNSSGTDGDLYLDQDTLILYRKESGSWAQMYNTRRITTLTGLSTDLNISVGSVGDYYFATDTNTLYGPKTTSGWSSSGTSVSGGFASGYGVPDPTSGAVGSWYLDMTTNTLYGPKVSSSMWSDANTFVFESESRRTTTITGLSTDLNSSTGYVGDYYYATDTNTLYGPKTTLGWSSSGTSVSGGFASGYGVPDPTLGAVGSWYLDMETNTLYGPKVSPSIWTDANTFVFEGELRRTTTISGLSTDLNSSTGYVGDYYYATDTNTLYGPKTTSGWSSSGTSVSGGFASGYGVPDPASGAVGSWYLDMETNTLYGPKVSPSIWSDANTFVFEGELRRTTTISGLSTDLNSSTGYVGDYYYATDTNTLYGPKTTLGWSSSGTSVSGGFASGYGVPDPASGAVGSWYLDMETNTLYGPKVSPSIWTDANTFVFEGELRRTMMLSGLSTDLNSSTGYVGDYYYATDTNTLYGPKTTSGWSSSGASVSGGFASGYGVPDDSLGLTGSWYLDLSTNTLYGPKTSDTTWTGALTTNLAQSSFLSGFGIPSNSSGTDGDLYLNQDTMTLYRKESGSWVEMYNTRRTMTHTGLSTDLNQSVGSVGDYYYATDTNTLYGPKTSYGWSTSGTSVSGGFASGYGVPDPSLGAVGSWYLDMETNTLYGPKTSAGSWTGVTTSVFESDSRRTTTISGLSTDLNSSTGFVGDYYYATDTNTLYGPKTTSGWSSSGISVSGGFASDYGVPDPSFGAVGSWYLDMETNTLYGPKTSSGWSTSVSLGHSSFLSGTSSDLLANGASIGVDGDFYYASDTGILYGPKTGGVWDTSVGIALSGGRFYSGTGVPSGTIGNVGDTYLDISTGQLYGPKTSSSSWTGVTETSIYQPGISSGAGPPVDGSVAGAVVGGFYLDTTTMELYGPYDGTSWANSSKIASFSGSLLYGSTNGSPPASSVGVEGDFFFDVSSGLMFGPRGSTGWSSSDSVRITSQGSTLSGSGITGLISSYGQVGDFYFDTATGMLYGPKTSSGWNTSTSISLTGGRFHSGTGAPGANVGSTGDYYYDQTASVMYGPKPSSGSWSGSSSFSIQSSGILSGTGAPADSLGSDGDFYYSTSQNILYGPKSGSWSTSPQLQTDAPVFLTGTTNPTSSSGNVGDMYLNTTTGELWGPKTSSGWGGGGISLGNSTSNGGGVISGTGPPTNSTGEVGSLYIDKNTLRIYGPKTMTAPNTFSWPVIGGLTALTTSGNCSGSSSSSGLTLTIVNSITGIIRSIIMEFISNPLLFIAVLMIILLVFVLWKRR